MASKKPREYEANMLHLVGTKGRLKHVMCCVINKRLLHKYAFFSIKRKHTEKQKKEKKGGSGKSFKRKKMAKKITFFSYIIFPSQ